MPYRTTPLVQRLSNQLQASHALLFGPAATDAYAVVQQVAQMALSAIARTDAAYHDVEHTLLVTTVGLEILHGKHLLEAAITPTEWTNFTVALLCHDIGYLKGICAADDPAQHRYATGLGEGLVAIAPTATDASLTPYHVDRGKAFVAANLMAYPAVDLEQVQQLIEMTRFPVPQDAAHQATQTWGGLARAADLIGQLSDRQYLDKLPALFQEFTETGAHLALNYRQVQDLRAGYPAFFWGVVQPLILPATRYLQATRQGQVTLANLYRNVAIVEQEIAPQPAGDRETLLDATGRHHTYLHDAPQTGATPEDSAFFDPAAALRINRV